MLVLVTNREDLTTDWLVLELRERGVAFVRFNTEDYPARATIRWSPDEAELATEEAVMRSREIDAVWWRRPLPPALPEHEAAVERAWAAAEAQVALDGFLRTTGARWVNDPLANLAADCKPEQLVRARRLGFDIPPTVVTNAAAELRGFASRHRRIVCKALLDARVPAGLKQGAFEERMLYTSVMELPELDQLDDLGPEPYLFQALVAKRYDVRVTVIGKRAFACRIESQAQSEGRVDWRRANTEALVHTEERLPQEVAEACVRLTAEYGLRFAAIDLARREDGGYTFFELNPNGQWAWVEQLTGLPLRAALADELLMAS